MATSKIENEQKFMASLNDNSQYCFYAHTTRTRTCMTHHVDVYGSTPNGNVKVLDIKVKWANRTWEGFKYETALRRGIAQCPEEHREELTEQIINKTTQEVREKADAMFGTFTKSVEKLSPENKERLANVVGEITNEEQAKVATMFAAMLSM